MQMRAQEQSPDLDADDFDDSSSVASNDSVQFSDDDDDIDFSTDVEQVLSHPIEFGLDFYSSEGLNACRNNGYVTMTSPQQPHPENVYSFGLSLSNLQSQIKFLSDTATAPLS